MEFRRYIPDKLAKLGNWESTNHLGKVLTNLDEPEILRIECAESLGKQGDPDSTIFLKSALNEGSDELVRTIIWSLGQLNDVTSIRILYNYRDSKSFNIKKWILKSLGRIEDKDSVITLLDLKTIYKHDVKLTTEIIRSLTNLYQYINKSKLIEIEKYFIKQCNHFKNTSLIISTLDFLLIKNVEMKTESLITLNSWFIEYKKLNLITSKIIELQGILNNLEFLKSIPISKWVVIGFAKAKEFNELSAIIQNRIKYDPETIGEALKLLPIEFETEDIETIDTTNPELKIGVLTYYAKREHNSEFLLNELKSGNLINNLLPLLAYYPDKAINFLEINVKKADKVQRQTILQLIAVLGSHNTTISKQQLLNLLDWIIENDQIWHIRRDARKLKNEINKK